jgi:hypothetical protein
MIAYVPSGRSILTRATRRDDQLREAKPAELGRARCCVSNTNLPQYSTFGEQAWRYSPSNSPDVASVSRPSHEHARRKIGVCPLKSSEIVRDLQRRYFRCPLAMGSLEVRGGGLPPHHGRRDRRGYSLQLTRGRRRLTTASAVSSTRKTDPSRTIPRTFSAMRLSLKSHNGVEEVRFEHSRGWECLHRRQAYQHLRLMRHSARRKSWNLKVGWTPPSPRRQELCRCD